MANEHRASHGALFSLISTGFFMIDVFLVVPLFLLAVALTGFARALAMRSRLMAIPTSRGSHTIPTPVGGGIAIVLTYLATLVFVATEYAMNGSELLMLAAGLPVAVVGLIDDRVQVSARIRLAVQFACVLLATALAGRVPALPIAGAQFGGLLFVWIVLPLCMVWLTNLYNFMDGIDGFAGLETVFVSLAGASILFANGDVILGFVCMGLFAGAMGFLVWNWPPARIFMGDVGSGFVGVTLGIVALLAHVHGSMSLWSWVLLLSCFIVDASFTLLRRIATGQVFYEAHRQHAFQHAARRYGSHGKVSLALLFINIVWLLPLAWLASLHPEHGVYFAVVGIVPLLILVFRLGAGKESL